MSTAEVLAPVAGALIAGGPWLAVLGLQRRPGMGTAAPGLPARWRRPAAGDPRRPPVDDAWRRWRWPVAAAVGGGVWLASGLPVGALIAAAVVISLPMMLTPGRDSARAIDRIEAVEEWARRLSDVLTAGVGLDQAIATTVRTCPDRIRIEVGALSARLAARWPTEAALRAFAADLDDATADLVVAALILGSRRRGPGLATVLAAVADSVAEDVAMRRKVEAERAKPRATARAVTLITLAVLAVGAWNGTYLRPYSGPLGQLVLLTLAACYLAALAWMHSMTHTPPAPRLLGDPHTPWNPS